MIDEIDPLLADIDNVSEEIRENAIVSLAQINDVKAIFALKKVAREDASLRLRHLAKKALMELRKEITSVVPDLFEDEATSGDEALQKLKRALASSKSEIRMNAVRSAVSDRDEGAVPLLQSCYEKEGDTVVRGSILIALGILGKKSMSEFLQSVLKHEKEALLQKAAIEGLTYTKDPSVYPLIVKSFAFTREKLVEKACMKALRKLGKDSLFQLFSGMMASSKIWRRQAVARAMGKFNSSKVVPLLEKAIQDQAKPVRSQAKRSLVRLAHNDNAAAQELIAKFGISLPQATMEKLQRSSVLVDSTTLASPDVDDLEHPDPDRRVTALQRLADAGDPTVVRTLRKNLESETDDRVRSVYVPVIARLGHKAAIPILRELLKDRTPRVRANAIEALSQFRDENLDSYFVEMLEDKDARTRANAIVALKDSPQIQVDRYIEKMVTSGDGRMIRSAIFAIEEVQSEKAVNLLGNLARGDSQALKEKALESLEILKERGNAFARKQLARLVVDTPETPPRQAGPKVALGKAPEPEPELDIDLEDDGYPSSGGMTVPGPLEDSPDEIEIPPPPGPGAGIIPPQPIGKPRKDGKAAPPPSSGLSMPDFSKGVNIAALRSWFEKLPLLWRNLLLATMMVWGLVVVLYLVESFNAPDAF